MEQFQINSGERIRLLESNYSLMRERLMVVNQNMIQGYKKTNQEVKLLEQEIKELKAEVIELRQTTNHLIQEMRNFARKDQLKVLEKYINLWNPLNFVTEKEVLEILEERGAKHRKTAKARLSKSGKRR